jgi:hypothetical protein
MLRSARFASLVALPLPSMQQPIDPSAVEHRLGARCGTADVAGHAGHPAVGSLGPTGRFSTDFPDFVLARRGR